MLYVIPSKRTFVGAGTVCYQDIAQSNICVAICIDREEDAIAAGGQIYHPILGTSLKSEIPKSARKR